MPHPYQNLTWKQQCEAALGPWALTWLSVAGQHDLGGSGLGGTRAPTGPSTGPPGLRAGLELSFLPVAGPHSTAPG